MEGLQYLALGMFVRKKHKFHNDRLIEEFGMEEAFERSFSPTFLQWTGLRSTRTGRSGSCPTCP